MKLRTNRNPVAQETFKSLGVTDRHVCEIEDLKEAITDGKCEGGEGVYSRVYPLDQNEVTQSVIDTKHSLFLTTMIMRNDFYEKLSPEVKAVLKAAALDAARKERETTIADGEEAKARLKAEGVNVHDLTEEETAEFKEKTKQVYDKFEPTFTPGLIDRIRKS